MSDDVQLLEGDEKKQFIVLVVGEVDSDSHAILADQLRFTSKFLGRSIVTIFVDMDSHFYDGRRESEITTESIQRYLQEQLRVLAPHTAVRMAVCFDERLRFRYEIGLALTVVCPDAIYEGFDTSGADASEGSGHASSDEADRSSSDPGAKSIIDILDPQLFEGHNRPQAVRCQTLLMRRGIHTAAGLVSMTRDDLSGIPGIGARAQTIIMWALEAHGLSLRKDS